MKKLKEWYMHNPIKNTILTLGVSASLLGILGYKGCDTSIKARNGTQATVLKKGYNNNTETDRYDTTIANTQADIVNTIPKNKQNTDNPTTQSSTNRPMTNSIPETVLGKIQKICLLQPVSNQKLPFPMDLTGSGFADDHTDKRDVKVPSYSSLLPKKSIEAIDNPARCMTEVRMLLSYHRGFGGNLTLLARQFLTKEHNDFKNKKGEYEGSTWFSERFLDRNDIGYSRINTGKIENIKAGDLIFMLLEGSSFRPEGSNAHKNPYINQYPESHIGIGMGTQSISLNKDMFKNIDINDDDAVFCHFINQRVDVGHISLTVPEYIRNKKHLFKKIPKIKFPTIQRVENKIIITGSTMIDYLPKYSDEVGKFRFVVERLLQDGIKDQQEGFWYKPTVYSLTDPSKFFENPDLYFKSQQFAQGLTTDRTIIIKDISENEPISTQVGKKDSTNNTLSVLSFLNTTLQAQLPITLIKKISPHSTQMIDEKKKHDLPIQQHLRDSTIAQYNTDQCLASINGSSADYGRAIVEIRQGDTPFSGLRDKIGAVISQYEHAGPQRKSPLSRSDMNESERINFANKLGLFWYRDNKGIITEYHYGDKKVLAGEHIIVHIPSVFATLKKESQNFKLLSTPSIPKKYFPIDPIIQQSIDFVSGNRSDITAIMMAIQTSETPGQGRDVGYLRKNRKRASEHLLLGLGINSQGPYQMRAVNYDNYNYKSTTDFMQSSETQTRLAKQIGIHDQQKRNQYRLSHGGKEIERIGDLVNKKNMDIKQVRVLFNKLVEMNLSYDSDDLIMTTFVSKLLYNDLIRKKKNIITHLAEIVVGPQEEGTKNDIYTTQIESKIKELLTNPDHRRLIDELTRFSHNHGERAIYQRLLIMYLHNINHNHGLDRDINDNLYSTPSAEDKKDITIYKEQINNILTHRKGLKTAIENKNGGSTKTFLASSITNEKERKKRYDLAFLIGSFDEEKLDGSINNMPFLINFITTVDRRKMGTNFLPQASELYTNPLFGDYLSRANVDKSHDIPARLLTGGGLLIMLYVGLRLGTRSFRGGKRVINNTK